MADAMGFKFTYSFDHGVHYGSPNRSSEMIISTEEAHAAAMLEQAFQTKRVADAINRLADAAHTIAGKTDDSDVSAAGHKPGSGEPSPEQEEVLRFIDGLDQEVAKRRTEDDSKPES